MTLTQKLKYKFIGDRAFYRHVITILLPIIVQNTITNVVSLLDNVMVGATGTLQMSAVAIVNQLLFVFYIAIFGGYAGAGIFAAQYVGAKNDVGVRHCFRAKLYIGAICLVIAFAVFLFLPKQLISLYLVEGTSANDAADTLKYGTEYMTIMLLGLPAFALSQAYGSTLREMGETKVPMVASVTAILANLVFNYVFIFGNDGLYFLPFAPMGVKGAAIATVISRFAEATIIIVYVHVKKHKFGFIQKVYRSFKIPRELLAGIIKKGSPLLINEVLWSTGMAAIMQCYSQRGLEVVAATNIATTVSNLFNVVFISMGNAIGIIIGHLLGAGELEKAKVSIWRLLALSVAACTVTGGVMAVVAPFVPNIYNTSAEVKNIAASLLFVVSAMMPFFAFSFGCYFTLRCGGKTMLTFVLDGGFTWLLSFSTAFLIAHFTNVSIVPMYLCVQLVEVLKCVIGYILIKKGVWINKIVK